MTRVGVFSDSHGDHEAIDELLEKMGYLDAVCFPIAMATSRH